MTLVLLAVFPGTETDLLQEKLANWVASGNKERYARTSRPFVT